MFSFSSPLVRFLPPGPSFSLMCVCVCVCLCVSLSTKHTVFNFPPSIERSSYPIRLYPPTNQRSVMFFLRPQYKYFTPLKVIKSFSKQCEILNDKCLLNYTLNEIPLSLGGSICYCKFRLFIARYDRLLIFRFMKCRRKWSAFYCQN